jgi:hypothetical protein
LLQRSPSNKSTFGKHFGNTLVSKYSLTKQITSIMSLQRAQPLSAASQQGNNGVKSGRSRDRIMRRIIKYAVNLSLQSETVHISADLTQNLEANIFQYALQADALASST